jgi:CDP-paratose 2-epimerase
MKILITGGCGFLGSNLASFFIKNKNQVFIIDSLERDGASINLNWLKSQSENQQLVFFKSDIVNTNAINSFFNEHAPFDFICHVAGQVAMTTSINNPRKDFETNALGTFNILEAARKFSPKSLIAYSSTNKVYGDLDWVKTIEDDKRYKLKNYQDGLDENIPLDFTTPYGCSKGSADQYVKDWAKVYGMKTVIFRHSSIYGGRQFASVNQGWIGWFCLKALEQKIASNNNQEIIPFTISGSGKQVRDVLHAQDLVDLYCCAYENKDDLNGQIFNIGGGYKNSLSLLELFDFLKKELSLKELKFTKIKRRTSDQDCFIADITKAKKLLNWSPNVTYEDGIRKMISWCKNILNLTNEIY